MAEYSNNAVQTVAPGANVLFTEMPVGCSRGYITHREGSGLVSLRAAGCVARYRVTFGGNIAIPTGGTVGPISVAIALEGEGLNSATATITPAAVEEYGNVFAAAFIDVPCGCCETVSVKNVSTQAINVANPNLIIERVA